jgi:hypothetical protein
VSPGKPNANYNRLCASCGKAFSTRFVRQIYCSREHANLVSQARYRARVKDALRTVRELTK